MASVKMNRKDDDEVFKVYKEKPYLNSNGEPFGLKLNGKTKEYVDAHQNVKGLLIPSLNKKKGATIELRKMSDVEYSFVEKLKAILTCLLDGFLSGDDCEI